MFLNFFQCYTTTDDTFIYIVKPSYLSSSFAAFSRTKAKATQESLVQPAGKIRFDLTHKKTDRAFGKERFFVGRLLSAKQ
jgi:hypothetical protein